MLNVIGLELSLAQRRLQSVGVSALVEKYSSKKGVIGDATKVIRQQELDSVTVRLTVSEFKTTPDGL